MNVKGPVFQMLHSNVISQAWINMYLLTWSHKPVEKVHQASA